MSDYLHSAVLGYAGSQMSSPFLQSEKVCLLLVKCHQCWSHCRWNRDHRRKQHTLAGRAMQTQGRREQQKDYFIKFPRKQPGFDFQLAEDQNRTLKPWPPRTWISSSNRTHPLRKSRNEPRQGVHVGRCHRVPLLSGGSDLISRHRAADLI